MVARGSHRIGEFSRRVGVSPELLRAWEQRYGLLRPVRSAGGFRLYGEADAERVARMRRGLEEGLSAAEAARVALEPAGPATAEPAGTEAAGPASGGPAETPAWAGPVSARTRLLGAIEEYDEAGVQAILDEALTALGLEAFLRELVLPALVEIGGRWQAGKLEVGQEHFASHLIRGRLLALGRLWGRGGGPLAVLACAPREDHDISLVAFGLLLRSYGWRILFLGADTPLATVRNTVQRTDPAAIVIVTFDPSLLADEGRALRGLGRLAPLFLSGPGASRTLSERLRVRRLDADLIEAAREVAMLPSA